MAEINGRNNSSLIRIVRTYLDLIGSNENPVNWFFSGVGIEYKMREISEFLSELEPQVLTDPSGRYEILRRLRRYYSLGKVEYDERRLL